jgi:hypothetical protein
MSVKGDLWYKNLPAQDQEYYIRFPYAIYYKKRVYTGLQSKQQARTANKLRLLDKGTIVTARQSYSHSLDISVNRHYTLLEVIKKEEINPNSITFKKMGMHPGKRKIKK